MLVFNRMTLAGGLNENTRLALCWLRAVRNRLAADVCSLRSEEASKVVRRPPSQVTVTTGVMVRASAWVRETVLLPPSVGWALPLSVCRYPTCAVRLVSARLNGEAREGVQVQLSPPDGHSRVCVLIGTCSPPRRI